jgi:hypothetical protein
MIRELRGEKVCTAVGMAALRKREIRRERQAEKKGR